MKNRLVRMYSVRLLVPVLFCASAAGLAARSPEKNFVWLSDIHWNPLADPTLTNKLAAAEPTQWEAILAASSSRQLSTFGQDTNWPLFSSALRSIKQTMPNPEFTIVTGDLLVHHFREHFDESATVHDDAAFLSFVRKAIEFVALQLKQIAPSRPVFVSLGNNDSDCGDYRLRSNGEFLHGTLPVMADLLKVSDPASLSAWANYGVYNVPHPTLKNYRIIAVNTVLFSTRYRNGCGSDASGEPGQEMISWLDAELAEARRNHQKVWLIYHIPPGVDGFATTRHNNQPVLFWKAQYAEAFDKLMARHRDTIAASFAGHTHMDDFRLNGFGTHLNLVLMTPALSPIVNQNPAFRVVQFQSNGVLRDQMTYYLTNLSAAGSETAPDWKKEYDFDQTWGLHQLDYKSFRKLYQQINASREAENRWSNLYSVSHPQGGSITPQSFRALHCASANSDVNKYQSCLSARE